MFNGLFNQPCGDTTPNTGCGCNYTWLILIVLFLCCCGGKMGSFCLCINPTCLILMLALLFCCGGLTVGNGN